MLRRLTTVGVVLLAPLLATASPSNDVQEIAPTALVSLSIPGGHDSSLTLRLDVSDTVEVCSPATLQVNGQHLAQDASGNGEGYLTYGGGGNVSASWSFVCEPSVSEPETAIPQTVVMTIWSIDDKPLMPEISFIATFRQTTPATFADVLGDAVQASLLIAASEGDEELHSEGHEVESEQNGQKEYYSRPDSSPSDADNDSANDALQREYDELDDLRAQVDDLHQLIFNKEAALMEHLGKPMPSRHHRHVPVRDCDSLRCVVKSLSAKFSHLIGLHGWRGHHRGHGHHGPPHQSHHEPPHHPHHRPHHRPPHGSSPPPEGRPHEHEEDGRKGLGMPPHGEFEMKHAPAEEERPLMDDVPHHGGFAHSKEFGGHGEHHGPSHGRGHGRFHRFFMSPILLTILALLAIVFGISALHGLRVLRKLQNRPYSERRAARRARRALRRESRATRHNMRKAAFKELVQNAMTRVFGQDVDDEDDENEKFSDKTGFVNETATTMEEEIAGFREAASIVDDLIAAEEGRQERLQHQRAALEPERQELPCPGYATDDEPLPAYTEEMNLVTDGFRYTPGCMAGRSSDSSSERSNETSSDRLGYNK